MEYDRRTPEQRRNNSEKLFITETLLESWHELVRGYGYGVSEIPNNTQLQTEESFFDANDESIRHSYLFLAAYDSDSEGHVYHLSHTEDKSSQFMYLDSRMQSNILLQLLEKAEQEHVPSENDADHYIASIRRLYALSDGEQHTTNPSDLHSLVGYTQRVETQYYANDIDCIITKKVVIQQLLDNYVISEIECGSHADDDMLDVPFEDTSRLFYSLNEKLSYSDVDDDIPEILEYLYHLQLASGRMRPDQ